jgi:hypothetical protein
VLQIIESESVTINLWRRGPIPTRLLLVSSDLQAQVRLEQAARDAGFEVSTARPESGPSGWVGDVVVLDLDQIGAQLGAWARAVASHPPARVLGFFSHVQEDVGRAAAAMGVEVYPRGRFWRELPDILGGKRL